MSDLDRLVGSLRLYADAYDGEASQYADDDYPDEQRECAALAALLTEAAATITRLREALEPFAKAAPKGSADQVLLDQAGAGIGGVTVGDLRRARQALGGEHG